MSELKACPFCGKDNCKHLSVLRRENFSDEGWNTRPLESALQSSLTTAQEENKRLEKHWDDCIDIVRELPTNSPLIEKARKLYAEWCDYYDAQSALNGGSE